MSIHKITDSDQPVFPCWLWHPEHKWRAINYHAMPAYTGWTHWHPAQPEPPTCYPTVQGDTAEGATPRSDEQIYYRDSQPVVDADFARTLERELASVKQERDELKTSLHAEIQRDGNWTDKWGACRVCGGEIPHGHTDNCDLFKYEKQITAHQAWEKQVRELLRYAIGEIPITDFEGKKLHKNIRLVGAIQKLLSTPPASGGTQT